MKARIIRIGDSQGVRIPKALLDQSGIGEDVELVPGERQIIIRSAGHHPRCGWEEAFRVMAERGSEVLLDVEAVTAAA